MVLLAFRYPCGRAECDVYRLGEIVPVEDRRSWRDHGEGLVAVECGPIELEGRLDMIDPAWCEVLEILHVTPERARVLVGGGPAIGA